MPSTRTVPLPLTPVVVLYATVSVAWLVLFVTQTALVASDRRGLHRRLGVVGAVLAAAFVVVGWVAAVEEARRGFDLSGDLVPRGTTVDPAASLVPLNAFVLFALLVGLAIWLRRRAEVHKRLMVFAMVGPVAGAPIAHVVGHWPVLQPVATAGPESVGWPCSRCARSTTASRAGPCIPGLVVGCGRRVRLGRGVLWLRANH